MALKNSARILICVTTGLLLLVFSQDPAWCATAESKYYKAERCAGELKKNPQRQKYREQWLRCIKEFLAVYRDDPHGPWAAAGLYQAGALYGELYKISFLEKDRREAIDLLDNVVRYFPRSSYQNRARLTADILKGGPDAQTAPAKSISKGGPDAQAAPAKSISKGGPDAQAAPAKSIPKGGQDAQTAPAKSISKAEQLYEKAKAQESRLQEKPALQKNRDQWLKSITFYRQAFQADPGGPLAPAALYGLADNYARLFKWSRSSLDHLQSQKTLQELVQLFPQSSYADKARAQLGIDLLAQENDADPIAHVIQNSDSDVMAPSPNASTEVSPRQLATVEGLRFWSNPRYTRVVIDANIDTIFTHRELREDPSIGKPQRIYIDMHNSQLSQNLQKVIPINDNLLSDARAGQYSADTVRVVVDIKSSKTYKIFSLKNPFRIVLDVWGVDGEAPVASDPDFPIMAQRPSQKLPDGAIVKQLALGVRRIVIDPGHGGKDFGAPGAIKGVHEKHIVLQLGRKLADKIRSNLACEVILTRDTDAYLSLEERTAIANTQYADLFISVHTNASPNKKANGLETFILNLTTDDESILVAARENATSTKNISDLDSILKDLMQNAKVSESTRLAGYVQQATLLQLRKKYSQIRNKGVKKAPFYVLIGATMPSILIETGFISNIEECQRLIDPDYQDRICQGIVDGIKRYIQDINPMALGGSPDLKKEQL